MEHYLLGRRNWPIDVLHEDPSSHSSPRDVLNVEAVFAIGLLVGWKLMSSLQVELHFNGFTLLGLFLE